MALFNDNILNYFSSYILDEDSVLIYDGQNIILNFSYYFNGTYLQIKIEDLRKSQNFSGNYILFNFEELVKSTLINYEIILSDASYINLGIYKFKLSTLKILLNGISWYNSKGYFQNNFVEESNNWNLIRNSVYEFDENIQLAFYNEFGVDINLLSLKNIAIILNTHMDHKYGFLFYSIISNINIKYTTLLKKRNFLIS